VTTKIEAWRTRPKLAKARLKDIVLKTGSHTNRADGLCALEAVAWLAGEPHSAHPNCTCPVIASMVHRFNDRFDSDATRTRVLGPLLPLLVGTRSSRIVMIKRGLIAADFAVRVCAPIALETLGFKNHTDKLRALAPIVDRETALVGNAAASNAANAASSATAYAAYAAAAYAAYAAAAAASNAAAYAAAAAAAASSAAAYAAYAPYAATAAQRRAATQKLYDLTVYCIKRMIACKEES
jgi:hypothetical protein